MEGGIFEGCMPWGIFVLRLCVGSGHATWLFFGFGCGLLVEGL